MCPNLRQTNLVKENHEILIIHGSPTKAFLPLITGHPQWNNQVLVSIVTYDSKIILKLIMWPSNLDWHLGTLKIKYLLRCDTTFIGEVGRSCSTGRWCHMNIGIPILKIKEAQYCLMWQEYNWNPFQNKDSLSTYRFLYMESLSSHWLWLQFKSVGMFINLLFPNSCN